MSSKYRIVDEQAAYYLTFTIVGWVDVFSRQLYRDIIIRSLKYCQENKGIVVYAYVIMSNHVHVIVSAEEGYDLSAIIRDFKKFTSKEILFTIQNESESRREWMLNLFSFAGSNNKNNKDFQVWQSGNHAVELFSNSFIIEKLDYVHNNPVRAAIVLQPQDYIYSSARNYMDYEETLLDVVCLTRPLERIR